MKKEMQEIDEMEAQAISDSLAWEKFYSQLLQFIGGAFLKPVRSRFYYLKGMK